MRTKALLSMAALAAGALTAVAQSNVYSLNIVGYANVPAQSGYSFQSAPFSAGVTNGLNEILPPNPYDSTLLYGPFDTDQVLLWNGHGWDTYVLDSSKATGFANLLGNAVGAPVITAGRGYLYNNQQGIPETITYVGQVRTGTNTVTFPGTPAYYAAGSPIPFAGGVTNALQMSNVYDAGQGFGPLDTCQIQTAKYNASGAVIGFDVSVFDTSKSTGFATLLGGVAPEPQIAIGEGFFFNNQNGYDTPWTQILNP